MAVDEGLEATELLVFSLLAFAPPLPAQAAEVRA